MFIQYPTLQTALTAVLLLLLRSTVARTDTGEWFHQRLNVTLAQKSDYPMQVHADQLFSINRPPQLHVTQTSSVNSPKGKSNCWGFLDISTERMVFPESLAPLAQ